MEAFSGPVLPWPALEEGSRGLDRDLSPFTYILRVRLEGSLEEVEKQREAGEVWNELEWKPAFGTVAHLSHLERQAFSFEVGGGSPGRTEN